MDEGRLPQTNVFIHLENHSSYHTYHPLGTKIIHIAISTNSKHACNQI